MGCCPLLACAHKRCTWKQAHTARVVDMKMSHDHVLDLARLDPEARAQLLVEGFLRRPEVPEQKAHWNAEVATAVSAHVGVHARVDQDRARGRVAHRIGEAWRAQNVPSGPHTAARTRATRPPSARYTYPYGIGAWAVSITLQHRSAAFADIPHVHSDITRPARHRVRFVASLVEFQRPRSRSAVGVRRRQARLPPAGGRDVDPTLRSEGHGRARRVLAAQPDGAVGARPSTPVVRGGRGGPRGGSRAPSRSRLCSQSGPRPTAFRGSGNAS